jgi:hypothetical protein
VSGGGSADRHAADGEHAGPESGLVMDSPHQ